MITDITVNNKYVLVYDGLIFKSGTLTTGQVTSPFTVEVFDNIQDIIDRGAALGLVCPVNYLVEALENGASLSSDCWEIINNVVWVIGSPYRSRMEAMGYSGPGGI